MALTLLRKQPPYAVDLEWAKKYPVEATSAAARCGVVLPGISTARSPVNCPAAISRRAPHSMPRAPAKAIPRGIPDAMRMGMSNDEINSLVNDGKLTRPALKGAMWEFGDQGLLAEAVRRGLIW